MQLCVIEGDGVGHEVIPAALRVLKSLAGSTNVPRRGGFECLEKHGTPLPDETIALAEQCRAVLFGAAESPSYPVEGYYSPIIALRQKLFAYANVRPTRYLPVATARPGVDMIIVRENTEDLYTGSETVHADGNSSTAQKIVRGRPASASLTAPISWREPTAASASRSCISERAAQSGRLFRAWRWKSPSSIPTSRPTSCWSIRQRTGWSSRVALRRDPDLESVRRYPVGMGAAWGGGLGLAPA